MASNLRVDQILPTTGTNIGIGTANGNIIVGGDNPRFSVNSVGRVAIGNTDPNLYNANTNGLVLARGNVNEGITIDCSNQAGIFFSNGSNGAVDINGQLIFYHTPNDESMRVVVKGSEKVRIKENGDVNVSAGGSVFIGNGNLVFSTAGTGIDFSATADGSGTVSSEILDDYEEGTWTPVIKSGTDTITATGNNQSYTYTKVGRKVTVYFAMDGATTSGTTGGQFKIEGLPYAMNGPTGNRTMGSVLMFYGSGLRAANWPVWIHLSWNSSILDIYEKSATANNYDRTTVGQVGAASYVFGQITYDAA